MDLFSLGIAAGSILKYSTYFTKKIGFDNSCKLSFLETICMNCQNPFPWKKKKNISLSSAALAQGVINTWWTVNEHISYKIAQSEDSDQPSPPHSLSSLCCLSEDVLDLWLPTECHMQMRRLIRGSAGRTGDFV